MVDIDPAPDAKTKIRMQVFVSTLVLFAALWGLLSKRYDETITKWAAGVIGVVIGYWLR